MKFIVSDKQKNGSYVCNYCDVKQDCNETISVVTRLPPFICCREAHHKGPHVACGDKPEDHPIIVWTVTPKGTKILKCTLTGYAAWCKRMKRQEINGQANQV